MVQGRSLGNHHCIRFIPVTRLYYVCADLTLKRKKKKMIIGTVRYVYRARALHAQCFTEIAENNMYMQIIVTLKDQME